jgi:hypothetical protein
VPDIAEHQGPATSQQQLEIDTLLGWIIMQGWTTPTLASAIVWPA